MRAEWLAARGRQRQNPSSMLQSATIVTELPRLVERGGEIAALKEALATVTKSSRGRLALLRGEAGIGKTALLAHFCSELGPSVRVLWASCEPLFTPRPMGPLLDVSRVTGGELERDVRGSAKPHDVAGSLLRELEFPAPTVLVIEDVQWADEATLDVLRLVARRIDPVPALIIASHRDEELPRSHPLRLFLGELPTNGSIARIELTGFSSTTVADLADGSPVDPEVLFKRTAGNPFFVTEALAAGTEEVPSTVRDAVLARASRLGPSARDLLDAAAVVPQPTELWLLEQLTAVSPAALDECLGSGMLVSEADCVSFRHELARLALEDSLRPDVRLGLHRRALAALQQPGNGKPDLARLTHHADAAGDGDAVLRLAPAAAEEAASVGAHREAQDQYGRALRFATDVPAETRAELLRRFADEGYLTDMREEAVDALDEALLVHRERGDAMKVGETQRLRSRLLVCIARTDEARTAANDAVAALEQLPPGPELARAYAAVSQVTMLADETEPTLVWGIRAIELAERVDDTEALVFALNNVGVVEITSGDPAGIEKLERSLALADRAGLETDVGRAYINLTAALARRHEWRAADNYFDLGIEYCSDRGLEAWMKSLIAAKSTSDLAQGRWGEAADAAASILDGPRSSIVAPRCEALEVLALVRLRRGDPGYRALLEEATDIARAVGEPQFIAPVSAARAEAAILEGRADAVAMETDDALGAAIDAGDPMLIGELAVWRQRAGVVEAIDADVGEPFASELAGEHERSAALWKELGCPYAAAFAQAGASGEAAMRDALDELQRLGAEPVAALVARRLRERGARGLPRGPRPSTQRNPAGLTAREIEVLALVADGLRNADIAQRLFLSEKTVGHHVSAILRKLEVRNRGEATAEGRRLGII